MVETENIIQNEWKHLWKIHYLEKLNKFEEYGFEIIYQSKLTQLTKYYKNE